MLDLLEEYAEDLIQGIELGDIEWFHRIRNSLYHEGNGITVDIEQLKSYRAVAQILYQNLFDIKPTESEPSLSGATGKFLEQWAELENRLKTAALPFISKPHHRPPEHLVQILVDNSIVDEDFQKRFSELRRTRNSLVHGSMLGGLDAGYVMQALFNLVNTLPEWKK